MKRKIEITTVEHIRILAGRCPLCGWMPEPTEEQVIDEEVSLVLTGEGVNAKQPKENSNPKGGKTK